MSFRIISKEALAGSITLGVVLVAGYLFGKVFKLKGLILTRYNVATTQL